MKKVFVAFLLIGFVISGYWLSSKYTASIGEKEVITDLSRGYVLTNNLIGDWLGYGREDFIGLSFYYLDDKDIELIAVKNDDGRMIGHMVSKHTAKALRELITEGKENPALTIARDKIGDRVIQPLRIITWAEIEPKQFLITLPIPE